MLIVGQDYWEVMWVGLLNLFSIASVLDTTKPVTNYNDCLTRTQVNNF